MTDTTLWTLLGDELNTAALPLPARVPCVEMMNRTAYAVRDVIEARLAVTVRPGRPS